jgi:peptide/nickel transport system ATP-binding protein
VTVATLGRAARDRPLQDVLLRAEHVVKDFPVGSSQVRAGGSLVHAVDDVSFSVRTGETLGLVGQTGCGKSTLARCVSRLCDLTSGTVTFDGLDISTLSRRDLRPLRRQIQVIFQEPSGSLNPRRRVGSIIGEPFAIHRVADGAERKRRVQELMEVVGLNPEHYNRFPGEFSGGQRQRVGIARALALRPRLIVCDEPVSALDVSIQAQVLNLLTDLQAQFDLTYIFIAHDLTVVRHVSDRVAVMYLGRIVEVADVDDLFERVLHPYSAVLLSAMPTADFSAEVRRERIVLPGELPSPTDPPTGCRFHPQCWKADAICSKQTPPLISHAHAPSGHAVACHSPLTAEEAAGVTGADRSAPTPRTYRYRSLLAGGDRVAPADGQGPTPRVGPSSIEARGPWRLAAERLRRNRTAMASLAVITLLTAWALAAPVVSRVIGHPPNEQYHLTGQTPEGLPVGPRAAFWLGTDDLGRDLLVRIGYGLRLSLLIGVVATLVTVAIGVVVGLVAGYLGGRADTALARLMDVVLAFPFLLFAISLVSVEGRSVRITIIVIALFSWASMARIVRGQVLSIREKDYIEAARSLGAGDTRIMVLDVLPNTLAPIIVYTTLLIPAVVVLEATLSFLGVGTPPPTADLGAMLDSSVTYYRQAWWFILFPAVTLLAATVALNLFGDGVRDALDPATARRSSP